MAEKKQRKPSQKRRFQTVAERSVKKEAYVWKEMLGSYVLQVQRCEQVPSVDVHIAPLGEGWTMRVVIDGKRFLGNRPNLEAAYKATAELLFKHAKNVWLREDAKVIMAPWSGIEGLLNETN